MNCFEAGMFFNINHLCDEHSILNRAYVNKQRYTNRKLSLGSSKHIRAEQL